jgi:hypothetical protein
VLWLSHTNNDQVQMRRQFAVDVMILAPRGPHTRRHAHKARTTVSITLAECLLGVLLVAAQVGSAQAYGCTSTADCQYPTCNDISCACSSSNSYCRNGSWTGHSTCRNGVWDAACGFLNPHTVSTTKHSETQCHSNTLHS